MKTNSQNSFIILLTEFAKLQLAGNIPFWGTYFGFMLFDKVLHFDEFSGLIIATVLANFLFFIVDDQWVFSEGRDRAHGKKTKVEIVKFVAFIAFSAFLSIMLVHSLSIFADISPYYGQFISGAVFTLWTFAGLRFWVFAPSKHHGLIVTRPVAKRRRTA